MPQRPRILMVPSARSTAFVAFVSIFAGCRRGAVVSKALPGTATSSLGDAQALDAQVPDGGMPRAQPSTPVRQVKSVWAALPSDSPSGVYPIVSGMCFSAAVQIVEGASIFMYGTREYVEGNGGNPTAAVVEHDGLSETPNEGLARIFGRGDDVITAGFFGLYPDRLFAVTDNTSQPFSNKGSVRFGSVNDLEWKTPLSSESKSGAAPGGFSYSDPVRFNNNYLFPKYVSLDRMDIGTGNHKHDAVTPDGEVLPKQNVPGGDIARLRGKSVAFEAKGEVLGLSLWDAPLLIRWSAKRKVDDIKLSTVGGVRLGPEDSNRRIVAGKTRAVLQVGKMLAYYTGDADEVTPLKLAPRLTKGFTWLLGKDDAVYVALQEGVLLREGTDGAITEVAIPAKAVVRSNQLRDFASRYEPELANLWLTVAGVDKDDDALFRRKGDDWQRVELPRPPFATAKSSRVSIDNVTFASADDVFITASQFENGWSWGSGERYRTVYRTKKSAEVMRCQDTRSSTGSGTGLWSWPTTYKTGEPCATPFVVVTRDPPTGPQANYPKVKQALAGYEAPEGTASLRMINFDARGQSNLGIVVANVETATVLAHLLGKKGDLHSEVVCARPEATRELDFDLKKGRFDVVKK
jgi:hypothetical protein